MKKLWTRDFTILTFGSVVSVFGNTLSGFAINLKVLDYSNSIFLFVLYMVIYNLPRILVPILVGPLLDSFSRRKTIYMCDFCSAALYILLFAIMRGGYFNYFFLLAMSITLGTVDSINIVAYESLYPVLVAEGNFRKAYSVSSMIMPLSAVMLPVAKLLYDYVGISPIFITSAVAFFVAACLETQIRADESHLRVKKEKYSLKEFKTSFREGVEYISGEKGLLVITSYFFVSTFSGSYNALILPFFNNNPSLGVMLYTLVSGSAVIGRFVGGIVQYRLDYPKDRKFIIALTVYFSISIIEMVYLFTPVYIMAVMSFSVGLLAVTSYNIRVSTTQSYIPDAKRARYNGAFQMFMNLAMIIGQLGAGALADFIPIRAVVISFNALSFIGTILIMWRGRRHVIPIYNRVV